MLSIRRYVFYGFDDLYRKFDSLVPDLQLLIPELHTRLAFALSFSVVALSFQL